MAFGWILVLAASAGFESLFVGHGLNVMDEGWPLHAAMEMHAGKTLYRDVFWVFPPGHVLPAWIAYAWEPPGLIGARILYAAFSVAAVLALYLAARRMMPADFALLAGLLAAIAAPRSHGEHLLFGYRYLAWSVIALLFFHRRLVSGRSRWLFPAGLFAGIALFFRLTPAFAVSAAIGVGMLAASRNPRDWLRDGLWYSAGIVLVWLPVLAWFHHSIGLEPLWLEMVVRPVEMTALQSKPIPALIEPSMHRARLGIGFALLGFRIYPVLLGLLLAFALVRWGQAVYQRRPYRDAFALSFILFATIFFSRAYGRADIPHLDSAIAPVAVLIAFAASRIVEMPRLGLGDPSRRTRTIRVAVCVVLFASWSFLNGSDRNLRKAEVMGNVPLESTGGAVRVRPKSQARGVDRLVSRIQAHTRPGDTIYVMSHAPLLYVLADRHSPGTNDFVMPGTYRTEADEQAFLELLQRDPPAAIVWPRKHFDGMPERGLDVTAPRIARWVREHYRTEETGPLSSLLLPRLEAPEPADAPSAPEPPAP